MLPDVQLVQADSGRAWQQLMVKHQASVLFLLLWHKPIILYLFSQIWVFLVLAIFFCSCSSPYMRASAVGGQPGT